MYNVRVHHTYIYIYTFVHMFVMFLSSQNGVSGWLLGVLGAFERDDAPRLATEDVGLSNKK